MTYIRNKRKIRQKGMRPRGLKWQGTATITEDGVKRENLWASHRTRTGRRQGTKSKGRK